MQTCRAQPRRQLGSPWTPAPARAKRRRRATPRLDPSSRLIPILRRAFAFGTNGVSAWTHCLAWSGLCDIAARWSRLPLRVGAPARARRDPLPCLRNSRSMPCRHGSTLAISSISRSTRKQAISRSRTVAESPAQGAAQRWGLILSRSPSCSCSTLRRSPRVAVHPLPLARQPVLNGNGNVVTVPFAGKRGHACERQSCFACSTLSRCCGLKRPASWSCTIRDHCIHRNGI